MTSIHHSLRPFQVFILLLCFIVATTVSFTPTIITTTRQGLRVSSLHYLGTQDDDQVDIAIVGAGIGGLCAGAILNTLYGKNVGVYESHYLPGGCAHAFDRKDSNNATFTFDSGPTILLG
jgi:hypothetical protein